MPHEAKARSLEELHVELMGALVAAVIPCEMLLEALRKAHMPQVELTHAVAKFLVDSARRNSHAPVRSHAGIGTSAIGGWEKVLLIAMACSHERTSPEEDRPFIAFACVAQASIEEEQDMLIYNYAPTYTGKVHVVQAVSLCAVDAPACVVQCWEPLAMRRVEGECWFAGEQGAPRRGVRL